MRSRARQYTCQATLVGPRAASRYIIAATSHIMETFIENVRAHQCLWNPQHPDYREKAVRDEAWAQVVKKCNDTTMNNVRIARLEWKKLRDNHREALKRAKLGQNKLLPAQITTWKYAKAMQFLEPFMKYRITEDIDIDHSMANLKHSEQDDVSTTEDNVKIESQSKRRRCLECTSDGASASRYQNDHDTDALESFFECVLKSTREMPIWMQTQVKKKIFAVIIESEEQLSLQNPSRTLDIMVETNIKTEMNDDD